MYLNEDDQEPGGLDENPEDVAEPDAFKDVVKDAITQLSERKQLFMALYHQEELNLKKIARYWVSVNREPVRSMVQHWDVSGQV